MSPWVNAVWDSDQELDELLADRRASRDASLTGTAVAAGPPESWGRPAPSTPTCSGAEYRLLRARHGDPSYLHAFRPLVEES